MSVTYDVLVKLLMLGDSGVGKSCLLLRFAEDTFTTTFITTIGIDFKIKTLTKDGKRVKLQIWDTAGQERFRTITTAYYKGAHGILLVYDVADRSSFDNIKMWMKSIDQHAPETVKRILIGNKADVSDASRAVSTEQGRALAAEYRVNFYECSAKMNLNVTEAFMDIAMQSMPKDEAEDDTVKPSVKPRDTKCC